MMDVRIQVGEKKYVEIDASSTELFEDIGTADAKRKKLDWIIRDKEAEAVRTIKVKVESPDGSIIKVDVNPLRPMVSVKMSLQRELNMAPAAMCLMWNGKVLENETLPHTHGINRESTILKVIEKKDVELSVTIPGGELVPLKMCNTSYVGDVIQTILLTKVVKENDLHLYHNDMMLCGMKLLRDYKIGEGSVKDVLQLAPGRKPITIGLRSLTGWYMKLDVDGKEWVADVKKKVEALNKEMPVDSQILIFNEATLHDDEQLCHYNIQNNDEVYIRLQLRGGGPELHLVTSMGQYIPYPTYKFDTVSEVKHRIEEQFGIPTEKQQLVIHRDPTLAGSYRVKDNWHTCQIM